MVGDYVMSMRFIKYTLPNILAFFFGISLIFTYYFTVPKDISTYVNDLTKWGIIIAAFALGLAAANLVKHEYANIRKKGEMWIFSVWVLLTFSIMTIIGLVYGKTSYWFSWLFNNTVTPVSSIIMGMWIMYMAASSYRAYRMRTLESAALGITVIVIMLRNTTIPFLMPFGPIGDWLMYIPTMAGSRGVLVGIAIGTLVVGIRRLIGVERTGAEQAAVVGE
jgi:hypothetical protein